MCYPVRTNRGRDRGSLDKMRGCSTVTKIEYHTTYYVPLTTKNSGPIVDVLTNIYQKPTPELMRKYVAESVIIHAPQLVLDNLTQLDNVMAYKTEELKLSSQQYHSTYSPTQLGILLRISLDRPSLQRQAKLYITVDNIRCIDAPITQITFRIFLSISENATKNQVEIVHTSLYDYIITYRDLLL